MPAQTLLAYALLAWLAAATPGPAVLLALRNGAAHGFRAGLMSTLGNQMGLVILAGTSVFGLNLILQTSEWLFTAVKWAGALYLMLLGWRMWRSNRFLDAGDDQGLRPRGGRDGECLRTGLWVALTNPKAILFFGALLPQFVQTSQPLLPQLITLLSVSVLASTCCLLGYVWLASQARPWLQTPGPAQWLNRIAGSVFIGFGLLLVGLRRP